MRIYANRYDDVTPEEFVKYALESYKNSEGKPATIIRVKIGWPHLDEMVKAFPEVSFVEASYIFTDLEVFVDHEEVE